MNGVQSGDDNDRDLPERLVEDSVRHETHGRQMENTTKESVVYKNSRREREKSWVV